MYQRYYYPIRLLIPFGNELLHDFFISAVPVSIPAGRCEAKKERTAERQKIAHHISMLF
jgi:hypothetical protein